MSRLTRSLLLVAGALLLLSGLAPARAQGIETVTVTLESLDSSGVTGSVVLTGSGPVTSAELTVSGLEAGSTYRVRMHAGSCDSPSASAAALPDILAGTDGTATSSGALLFQGRDDVALSMVADGEHVIIVSLGAAVACGTIPRLSTRGSLIAGSIPPAGGFGLVVFGGGTYEQLVTATGCPLASARFWVIVDGQFIVLIPGARVASVNAPFDEIFGGSIPSWTVLIGTCPAATTGATLSDGTSFVFVRSIGESEIVVDPALFLSGDEAVAAAREDGVIAQDEDLPNDFYIRNAERALIAVPVDEAASFTLIGFSDGGALQDTRVTFPDLRTLLSGSSDTSQYYSIIPGDFPMTVVVKGGVVVSGAQQYLP